MTRTRFIPIFIAALLFLFAAGNVRADGMAWLPTYANAVDSAKKADQPILLLVTTDWSGWGRKMDAETFADAKVISLMEKFAAVRANAEKAGAAQAKQYGVATFPTILFLNADGKLLGKIIGYETAEVFAGHLADARRAAKEIPLLEAALAKKPKDGEAAAKLAAYAAAQWDAERTVALLQIAEAAGSKNADLPTIYNAVADIYQERQEYARAIPLFKKALATGKDPKNLAYAHISIGVCYLEQAKTAEALPEFRATVAVPNAPADLKKQAQDFLKRYRSDPVPAEERNINLRLHMGG